MNFRRSFVIAFLAAVLPFSAQAQQTTLPGGYASVTEYLVGTWRSEFEGQPAFARFERNGAFTIEVTVAQAVFTGSYGLSAGRIYLRIVRTCQRGQCETHNPPKNQDYPVKPIDARTFMSADETYRRQ